MSKIGGFENFNGLDKSYFAWFAIYIAIGIVISFTLPFPISILIYIGIILLLQTYRIKIIQDNYHTSISKKMTKQNKSKFREFINSISNILYGNPYASIRSEPLRFVCMYCGKEHKERECPNCGSMGVKVI